MTDYTIRKPIYEEIEKRRNSKLIAYITGDRPGMETQVSKEVDSLFVDHLDSLWKNATGKITLIMYTRGGDTAAAWSIINLLHTFCDELEIVVPLYCHSAGTLMCLGADKIIMTKQATLSPIDPSCNNPLNPQIPGAPEIQRAPVSVEAVQGYLDLARRDLKIRWPTPLSKTLIDLSNKVHPLVLGQVFRTRTQIRDLAKRLLKKHNVDKKKRRRIVEFLCSDSGSHDYTINRREAKELGLNVENPDDEFYELIKNLYKSYSSELRLLEKFDLMTILAGNQQMQYSSPRALVESVGEGSNQYTTEGTVSTLMVGAPPNLTPVVNDKRSFEGWKKVH